ncbi:MAG: TIR domain-containing protein [Vicinamibacteraceae bacterium]|nr:TIR domain-containing protein [Vicinamibacteraceae bacterium]
MAKVFISYRRSDASGEAGRLSDSLRRAGRRMVFRDVDDLPKGYRFEDELLEELAAVDVVLVLIGPIWLAELTAREADARVDYLRLEVATAIRSGKRVIPVLLRNASLPEGDELPADLAALPSYQAVALHDASWSSDVDRLLDVIGRPFVWKKFGLRCAVAFVVVVTAVWSFLPSLFPERGSDYEFARLLVVLLMASYLLCEYAVWWRYFAAVKGKSKGPTAQFRTVPPRT